MAVDNGDCFKLNYIPLSRRETENSDEKRIKIGRKLRRNEKQ